MGNSSSKKTVLSAQQSKVDNGVRPILAGRKDGDIDATPADPVANTIEIEQQRQLQEHLGVDNLSGKDDRMIRLEHLLSDRLDRIESKQAANAMLFEENREQRNKIKIADSGLEVAQAQNAALVVQVHSLSGQLTYVKQGLSKGHPGHLGYKIGKLRQEKAELVSQHEMDLAIMRSKYNEMRGHLGLIIGHQRQKIREFQGK